jgi:hypothetical protein
MITLCIIQPITPILLDVRCRSNLSDTMIRLLCYTALSLMEIAFLENSRIAQQVKK